MNIKDEDWIDLLAGRDVEGVDEQEKALVTSIREHLLKDNDQEFEVSEEEMEAERQRLFQYWNENMATNNDDSDSGTGDSNEGEASETKPAASNVIKFPGFRRVAVPLAAAASVAIVAVTLNLRDPYPEVSPGYLGGTRTSASSSTLEIVTDRPGKVRKQIKQLLTENQVEYNFSQQNHGWEGDFSVKSEVLGQLNQGLNSYGVTIPNPGEVQLIIRESK